MKNELQVVFGAGQVGFFLAKKLLEAGKRVRIVKRNAGGIPDGCEFILGDALDQAVCRRATRRHNCHRRFNPGLGEALSVTDGNML